MTVLSGCPRHSASEEVRAGEKAEVRTPSGKRMDRYDAEKKHIREIKPDNARGQKAGEKQLEGYKQEMDAATRQSHTTELTTYPTQQPTPPPDASPSDNIKPEESDMIRDSEQMKV